MILSHKLLPVNNIDIIFNFQAPITLEQNGITYDTPGNIYFWGFTDSPTLMNQQGEILTIGASFFPAGFFPFFKIPISEFRNRLFRLDSIIGNAAIEIEAKLRDAASVQEKIELLEDFFLHLLDQNVPFPPDTFKMLSRYYSSDMSKSDFCRNYDVHPRKFERSFNKYIGTTPKLFSRVRRFHATLANLINKQQKDLTTLSHEFDFYDQPHFIKDFKSLAGTSPSKFLKENRSFKQIIKII